MIKPEIIKHYRAPREDGSDRLCFEYLSPDDPKQIKWSALHDAILDNIIGCLNEYTSPEVFSKAWTNSIFPERLAKCVEQIVEDLGYKRK